MKIDVEIIQRACKALNEAGIVDKYNKFPKEFKGYTSAFGVAVVQMGLYPALLIYEDENARTNADRHKLSKALHKLLRILHKDMYNDNTTLSTQYANKNVSQRKEMQTHVDTALVALKLALRIYKPE